MKTYKSGKQQGLSGRDLYKYIPSFTFFSNLVIFRFTFNPDLVVDDNTEEGDIAQRVDDQDTNEVCYCILYNSQRLKLRTACQTYTDIQLFFCKFYKLTLFCQDGLKAFEINEDTFCTLDSEGRRLLDFGQNDDKIYNADGNEIAEARNIEGQIMFDANLFDNVDDLPDDSDLSSSEEEEEEEFEPETEKTAQIQNESNTNLSQEVAEKLRC